MTSVRVPWLLIGAFVLLGIAYIYAIPNFETPDELYHVGVVHHIHTEGKLPVQERGVDTFFRQEGSQPPLYYLTVALLTLPFDWSGYPALLRFNPHANIGEPGLAGNKNRILHDGAYPPDLTGTTLAVRSARLISLGLGAVTVFAVFAAARTLLPDAPALATIAAGITAFNPQFLFIAASINNDNLVTALNSLVVWQILVMLRDGFDRRRGVLLAVLLTLASLSKLSGLVLMPVAALAALWTAYRRRDVRGLLELGVMVGGVWLVLAGWWYARNLVLYDELFGTERMLDVFGRREAPVDLAQLLGEFEGLWTSYWGVFGWFSILTETWFYRVVNGVAIITGVGLVWHLWRSRMETEYGVRLFLLSLLLTLGMGSLIAWTMQTPASQGRLLFPYITATSILLALGLRQVRIPPPLIVVPLGLFAAAVPFITLIPTYQQPQTVPQLPADAVPVDLRFGDVRLIGYDAPDVCFTPGDTLPLTLYWQPAAQSPVDYTVSIEVALPDSTVIGGEDTFPGWGSLRTTTWEPGTIYADHYHIPLSPDATGAGILRINMNVWEFPDRQFLPITTADAVRLDEAVVPTGAFGLLQDDPSAAAIHTTEVTFGELMRLRAYQLDGDELTLWWEALATPPINYTVVAAVVAGGDILAQGDAPPTIPTRFFMPGDRFRTQHTLAPRIAGPITAQPLLIGWYDPDTLQRLPLPTGDTLHTLLDYTTP